MKNNIDEFLKIEEKYGLYEDVIQGVNYWNYIRFWMFNYDIMEQHLGLTHRSTEKKKVTLDACRDLFRAYLKGRKQLHHHGKRDVMFIVHPRRVETDGVFMSSYTDCIEEMFDTSISIEVPHPFLQFKNVMTKNIYYPFEKLISFKLSCFWTNKICKNKKTRLVDEIKTHLQKPFQEINEIYGIDLNIEKWANEAAGLIPKVKYYRKVMNCLLDKFDPKIVVEVVSYNTYCMAFNEVARERNIPIIELQHGTMHADHAGYIYSTDKLMSQLPNEILIYSDYWKTFAHMPKDCCSLVTTGFPYFENFVASTKNGNIERDDRITIAFVSQETVGAELSLLATDLAKVLPKEKYRIIYKLHPGECATWKSKYGYMSDGNIEVIDSSNFGIYYLFSVSDIQVGVYSSAIYEGLGFGLKTYLYKIGHANTMEYLVEQGYAEYFDDVHQLVDMIEHSSLENEGASSFWKTDSMNNVVNEIKRVGGLK